MLLFMILLVVGCPFPICIFGAYIALRQKPRLLRWTRAAALAFLVACLGFWFSGARFTIDAITFFATAFAVGSYCFLASSAFEIRLKSIRITLLLILGVPICALTGFATIGSMFSDPPPHKVEQVRADLVCREGSYGMVGAGGDRIGLYKSWRSLPFIEKQVAGDISPDVSNKRELKSCADLLRQYDHRN